MDIKDSDICNRFSIKLIADYYQADEKELVGYYEELRDDMDFLNALNEKIEQVRFFYDKGIFSRGKLDRIEWFANQRISLYVLLRFLKPDVAVETGVLYGGTTAFMLNALKKNKKGSLISIDIPASELVKKSIERHINVGNTEAIPPQVKAGVLVPEYLKGPWQFIEQESLSALKEINIPFSFFSHDSEHKRDHILAELDIVKQKMPLGSTVFADDIDWSNGFIEFCVNNKIYPLFLTDNGKSGLKVRLGLARMDHPNNGNPDVTG